MDIQEWENLVGQSVYKVAPDMVQVIKALRIPLCTSWERVPLSAQALQICSMQTGNIHRGQFRVSEANETPSRRFVFSAALGARLHLLQLSKLRLALCRDLHHIEAHKSQQGAVVDNGCISDWRTSQVPYLSLRGVSNLVRLFPEGNRRLSIAIPAIMVVVRGPC